MDFGSYIRQLRRDKQLTQRAFAEQLEVDFTYISKIENGKTDNPPSEDVIRKMAQILEIDADRLLDLAGKFNQSDLRRAVEDTPEIAILLRRLQSGNFTPAQINKMIQMTNEIDNE